ncbi:Hsp20/alpha crystallin family protein [Hymenobacter qilianensis]|uniref:Hsp20/alpha crystallin family protein n=1 Tax=Hymenobacter qilianensis TaxID=1385715 RepID=A0A7H0GY83_9BACT|nr:Hsp20/alpha crystallin family protein [Hymenobacter qilianensis]QNP53249.1 Hsp20/alpha crystallin family protein [Hymenobacter qilianensis]
MAIQQYQDSFSGMSQSPFSAMLDRFFNDTVASRGRLSSFSPQVDAYETERGYQIEAALPGMKREDIKVDFQQGRLTISGERQFKNEQNDRRYHLVESSYGSFQRSFQLPDAVSPDQIEASFEDGVLRVMVPKDTQKTMRHQIDIRGGKVSAAVRCRSVWASKPATYPCSRAKGKSNQTAISTACSKVRAMAAPMATRTIAVTLERGSLKNRPFAVIMFHEKSP